MVVRKRRRGDGAEAPTLTGRSGLDTEGGRMHPRWWLYLRLERNSGGKLEA